MEPMYFDESLDFFSKKVLKGEPWSSEEWQQQAPAVRVKSFFSARQENAQFINRAQWAIWEFLTQETEEVTTPNGEKTKALKTGSRADFVKKMRDHMASEGMTFDDVDRNDVTDIRSSRRLELIFDTNVRQAYGYGQWRQGMSPIIRRQFPAMRFVRRAGVEEKRPRHAASEGDIRLKTDYDWWSYYQNAADIGGFMVPWAPFGFGSQMDQEDVSREEAKAAGLEIKEDKKPLLPNLNKDLQASVRKMDPDLRQQLLQELNTGPKGGTPAEQAKINAERARYAAVQRSYLKAKENEDEAEAERIGGKLAEMPNPSPLFHIVDDFVKIIDVAADLFI